jgi:hypothetical protein
MTFFGERDWHGGWSLDDVADRLVHASVELGQPSPATDGHR